MYRCPAGSYREESAASGVLWLVDNRISIVVANVTEKGTWLVFDRSENSLWWREVPQNIHRLAQLCHLEFLWLQKKKLTEACWCKELIWY